MVRESLLTLARFAWPSASPRPRWTATLWVCLAVLSVGSSLHRVYLNPSLQIDLTEVRSWINVFFVGHSPYELFSEVDYPPHAFAVLSWMALGSDAVAFRVFPFVSTAGAVAASWLIVRWFARLAHMQMSRLDVTTLTAMLLASRAVRRSIENGQSAPFVIAVLVLALLFAPRRPWLAGVCFAAGSFKLNIAVGFGFALVCLGSFTPLAVAGGLVAIMTWAVAWAVQRPVFGLISSFLEALSGLYGGPDFTIGVTGIRSLLLSLLGRYDLVQVAYPLMVGLLLGALLTVVLLRPARDPRSVAAITVGCLLWAMLSLTNQRYNTLLIFPAVWLMQSPNGGLIRNRRLRQILPAVALIPLIVNVPAFISEPVLGAVARLPPMWAAAAGGLMAFLSEHATRLVAIAAFVLVLRELARPRIAGLT